MTVTRRLALSGSTWSRSNRATRTTRASERHWSAPSADRGSSSNEGIHRLINGSSRILSPPSCGVIKRRGANANIGSSYCKSSGVLMISETMISRQDVKSSYNVAERRILIIEVGQEGGASSRRRSICRSDRSVMRLLVGSNAVDQRLPQVPATPTYGYQSPHQPLLVLP